MEKVIKRIVLSTKQYAELRGVTQRTVQKSIAFYKHADDFSQKAFPGVCEIIHVGDVANLIMENNYLDIIREFKKEREKRRKLRAKAKK